MNRNQPPVIGRFYDELAAEDFADHCKKLPFYSKGIDFLNQVFDGGLRLSARLLDVGCGPGHLTASLPGSVQVVGIDLSEQMLKLARAARPKGDYFTHDFHYPLPSDKGPFDIIFASSAFDLCNDLGEVLSAMAAALNEQGLFYFTIAEHRLVTPNNSEYERSARPGRSEPIWLHFFSFQEVSAALAQAGLYPVSYQYAEGYRSRSLNSSFDYGYWIAVKGQESRDLENATIQICNPTT